METTTKGIVLPWFQPAESDTCYRFLSLQKMHAILIRAGFKVDLVFDKDGQILNPILANPPPNGVWFQVELPTAWSLVEGYSYGKPDLEYSQILDARGYLRGSISYHWKGEEQIAVQANLYTRYYKLNLGLGFYRVPLEKPDGYIADVIVDRKMVDYRKPNEFPVVAYHHYRPERPFMKTRSDWERFRAEIKRHGEAELTRIQEGRPQLEPPVYRWLHENVPEWEDPLAYWDE